MPSGLSPDRPEAHRRNRQALAARTFSWLPWSTKGATRMFRGCGRSSVVLGRLRHARDAKRMPATGPTPCAWLQAAWGNAYVPTWANWSAARWRPRPTTGASHRIPKRDGTGPAPALDSRAAQRGRDPGSPRRCSYWITIYSALTHRTARPQTTICCHSSRPAILCRLPPTCEFRIDRQRQRHACVDFNQGQNEAYPSPEKRMLPCRRRPRSPFLSGGEGKLNPAPARRRRYARG